MTEPNNTDLIEIKYSIHVDDYYRRAVNYFHGRTGLATDKELQRHMQNCVELYEAYIELIEEYAYHMEQEALNDHNKNSAS